MTRFLDRIASWKTLVILLILYVSFPAYWLRNAEATINQLAGRTIGPIDLTMGFDPQRTLQMVANYGDRARAYYAQVELTIDVAYPLVYGLLLAVALTLLFRNNPRTPSAHIALFLLIPVTFDYLENITIVAMLHSFPLQSMMLAVCCEVCKLVKWLSFFCIWPLIIYGLYTRLQRKTALV